jgi:adenylate kinase
MKTVLFHGTSGSGKDTQVQLLVDRYAFESISTGDMFRAMYQEGDDEAIEAHQYWSKGIWVPNELTHRIFKRWVDRSDSSKNWAFISVVRHLEQVEMFDELLNRYKRELDSFVYFSLSDDIAIERMVLRWVCNKCNAIYHEKYKPEIKKGYCDVCSSVLEKREDDTVDSIKQRISENKRTVEPIINAYKQRDIFIEIDASHSIEDVHKVVVDRLGL